MRTALSLVGNHKNFCTNSYEHKGFAERCQPNEISIAQRILDEIKGSVVVCFNHFGVATACVYIFVLEGLLYDFFPAGEEV